LSLATNTRPTSNTESFGEEMCPIPGGMTPFQPGPDEVVAGPGSGGTFADVGKVRVVRRISELHAVVATRHVWHLQDLRSFAEV
jgi:hypothetical protein